MTKRIDQANVYQLFAQQLIAVSANGTGVDTLGLVGTAQVILNSGAGGGTNPTLNVKLQESDALASGYTDVPGAAFTEVTDAAALTEMLAIKPHELKRYVRAVATITGTNTPLFAFSVSMLAVRQAGRNASQSI